MSCNLQPRRQPHRFKLPRLLTQGQTDLPVRGPLGWPGTTRNRTTVRTNHGEHGAQWPCPWISGWNTGDKREETNFGRRTPEGQGGGGIWVASPRAGVLVGKGGGAGERQPTVLDHKPYPSPPNYSFLTKMQANSFYLRVRQDKVLKRLYVCS